MTDTKAFMKWFYRALLALLVVSMSYVVFQRSYNFAHWVPHSLLRNFGMPYSALLFFESNADKILHPLGAFLLMVVLIRCQIPNISYPKVRPLILLVSAISIAEIAQWSIGRGFDPVDLALGMLGIYVGYIVSS